MMYLRSVLQAMEASARGVLFASGFVVAYASCAVFDGAAKAIEQVVASDRGTT